MFDEYGDGLGSVLIMGDGEITYDVAQVCMNGHVINRKAKNFPVYNTKHCQECGQPTITTCPHCSAEIRGEASNVSTIVAGDEDPAPKYCLNCGKPYPWTEASLKAAREMIDEEAENLNTEEKEQLKSTLVDITVDSPKTPLAASRYKRLTAKAGAVLAEGLRSILAELIVSNAKGMIWPHIVK